MFEFAMSEQIDMLRVQLETTLRPPLMVIVSSARADDGKGLVAGALGRSMDAAGYSTLLVLADERTRDLQGALEPRSLEEVSALGISRYAVRESRTGISVMPLPGGNIREGVSRESVARFGATCRKSYQITIVEAPSLLTSSFAMLAAIAADGVLLTVREGRRVCADDRRLAKSMAIDEVPFLGVVSVAASLIRIEPPQQLIKRFTQPKGPVPTVTPAPSREGHAV